MISADSVFGLGAAVFGLACLGFWVDTHPIGRKVAGAVWVIVGGAILSNTGLIPLKAPTYDFVGQYVVPLAIPLLLLKANLGRIFRESGVVLFIFLFAAIATTLAATIGFFLFDLGDNSAKIAGVYTGGWIGGAMNQVAVAEAVQLPRDEFGVAISASNPPSILALLTLLSLPSFALVRKLIPSRFDHSALPPDSEQDTQQVARVYPAHIAGSFALSFFICFCSFLIAEQLGIDRFAILVVTAMTVAIANVAPSFFNKIEGDFDLGMLLMYVFFAVVGAGTDLTIFLDSAVILFVYGLFIIYFHIAFMLIVAKFMRFDLAETIVASGAALVGPAATAAVATSRGWRELVTPAIMCGILGYVISNFIGVTLTTILQ